MPARRPFAAPVGVSGCEGPSPGVSVGLGPTPRPACRPGGLAADLSALFEARCVPSGQVAAAIGAASRRAVTNTSFDFDFSYLSIPAANCSSDLLAPFPRAFPGPDPTHPRGSGPLLRRARPRPAARPSACRSRWRTVPARPHQLRRQAKITVPTFRAVGAPYSSIQDGTCRRGYRGHPSRHR
jgi:hypothetical protein